MNELIKKLNENINNQKNDTLELENQLREEYFSIIDDMTIIKKLIIDLENSTDYSNESYYPYWPCAYIHSPIYDLKDDEIFPFILEYLEENYCIHHDENNCFILSCGPSIIIQDDGTVYDQDSDKIIIDKNDYENEKELYQLIEDFMEKNGCFPGVFKADRYGSIIGLVSTQKYLKGVGHDSK